jgi:hypothetical protein
LDRLDLEGRFILHLFFRKKGYKDVDWIHLAQDINERSVVVGQIRELRFQKEVFGSV